MTLGGVPVPIPGVGVMPVPGLAPVPIPGDGAMKVPPPPPIPPPPIEGARAPPVPCARAVLALPAESIAAKTTINFGCVMIALAVLQLCFVNWPDIGAEVNDKARPSTGFLMPFRSPEGHVAAVRAQKSDRVSLNNSNASVELIPLLLVLLLGFACGYAVRAAISRRHRAKSRRRHGR